MTGRLWAAVVLASGAVLVLFGSIVGLIPLWGPSLLLAVGGIPAALLLWVTSRIDREVPVGALFGGTVGGILAAVLGQGLVLGLAWLLLEGPWAVASQAMADLPLDQGVIALLTSGWLAFALVDYAIATPIVEEVGKAAGGWLQRPTSRVDAFAVGVAAGVGFATLENVGYATGWYFLFPGWEPIVAGRMLGSAVHPLATALVTLGWWDLRRSNGGSGGGRLILGGMAVHGVWNGSLVAASAVADQFEVTSLDGWGVLGIAHLALMGALAVLGLWALTRSVAEGGQPSGSVDLTTGPALAGLATTAALTVVPVGLLALALA